MAKQASNSDPDWPTDELIGRIRAAGEFWNDGGPKGPFNELIQVSEGDLIDFAKRMTNNHQDAEDIVQVAFLNLYTSHLPEVNTPGMWRAYVFSVVRNAFRDHYRKKNGRPNQKQKAADHNTHDGAVGDKVRPTVVSLDAGPLAMDPPSHDPSVEHEFEVRTEWKPELLAMISQLSDEYRSVIVLSHFEQLTNSEIADQLGTTVPSVKGRLHRAMEKLTSIARQKYLSGDGPVPER